MSVMPGGTEHVTEARGDAPPKEIWGENEEMTLPTMPERLPLDRAAWGFFLTCPIVASWLSDR